MADARSNTAEGVLIPRIRAIAARASSDTARSKAILEHYLNQVVKPLCADPAAVAWGVTDGPNDGGLDGWAIDEDKESPIVLVQCKWFDPPGRKLTNAESTELAHFVTDRLIPDNRAGLNREVLNFMAKRLASYSTRKLKLVYLTNGEFDAAAVAVYSPPGNVHEFELIDEKLLAMEWYDALAREQPISSSAVIALPQNQFFVTEFPTTVPSTGEKVRVLQSKLWAPDLIRAWARSNRKLLIRNLRYGLGNTGFNKGLKATAESPERSLFYVYNNGISVVCDHFDIVNVAKGYKPTAANLRSRFPKLADQDAADIIEANTARGTTEFVFIEGIQIVNGGQSTATLATLQRKLLDEIWIPCKISETSSKSLASAIARYNNSQNRLTSEQLVANSEEQTFLQVFGATELNPPLFYRRKKGDAWTDIFRATGPAPSKERWITFENTFQAFAAFQGNPGEAYGSKSKVIDPNGALYRYAAEFPRKDIVLLSGLLDNFEDSSKPSTKPAFDFEPYWNLWAVAVFGHLLRYGFNQADQNKIVATLLSSTGLSKWKKVRQDVAKVFKSVMTSNFPAIDADSFGYFLKLSQGKFDLSSVGSVKPSDIKSYIDPKFLGPDLLITSENEEADEWNPAHYQVEFSVFAVLVDRVVAADQALQANLQNWSK